MRLDFFLLKRNFENTLVSSPLMITYAFTLHQRLSLSGVQSTQASPERDAGQENEKFTVSLTP